jgi:hypothetical protein
VAETSAQKRELKSAKKNVCTEKRVEILRKESLTPSTTVAEANAH